MKEYENLNLTLSVNEVYAIQGIILGLTRLTGEICKDYHVDNMDLYHKLDTITSEWVKTKYSQNPT